MGALRPVEAQRRRRLIEAPVIGPRLTCAAGLRLAAIGLSLTRGAPKRRGSASGKPSGLAA